MIGRQEAIDVLYDLINSGLLAGEMEDELQDIINCIEAEDSKLHVWGIPDEDYTKLNACPCSRQPDYAEFMAEVDELYKKYKFTPSEFEQEEE